MVETAKKHACVTTTKHKTKHKHKHTPRSHRAAVVSCHWSTHQHDRVVFPHVSLRPVRPAKHKLTTHALTNNTHNKHTHRYNNILELSAAAAQPVRDDRLATPPSRRNIHLSAFVLATIQISSTALSAYSDCNVCTKKPTKNTLDRKSTRLN